MDPVQNIQAASLSSFVWETANELWGDFKHPDFARIIIPLLLLRRMECVLEPTKEDVLAAYESEKGSGIDLNIYLPNISKLPFYNTSQYTMGTVGSTHTRSNLEQYVSHFSPNVRLVFEEFGFNNTIEELDRAKLLYRMVSRFSNIDLHPDVVSNRVLSNAYEDLIRKFAASINEKAGEFMTPKDVVRLTTKLVLSADEEIFTESGVIRSVYDPSCGLLGFITDAMDQIEEMGSTAKIVPYGQELDPKTHAMALTSMLILGWDGKNIVQGSTLSNDKLSDKRFHYGLANPPFGIKWDKDKSVVEAEHKNLGYAGRFGPGLPRVSDGSMLFLMHLVSRMEDPENGGGRVGIVLSGSPLFTGDAGSGESEIRRWLLEQDYVEGIIALPNDMFFNTGIGTYVWILSNKKADQRKGKVQLINLGDVWTSMRKSEGTKRRYLTDDQIDDVVRLYDSFTESEKSKIFDTNDFAFRKVAIKRPLRGKLIVNDESIAKIREGKQFQKLSDEQQKAWISYLEDRHGEHEYEWAHGLVNRLKNTGKIGKTTKALGTEFTNTLFQQEPEGDIVTDSKGNAIPDTSLNDTENVPFKQDVEAYFEAEVLPHLPDAFIDYSVRDEKDGDVGIVGYEINFNRYFYTYVPPRSLHDIDAELKASEAKIQALLEEVADQ
jgi:type I restriction enzyme M protein